MDGRGPFRVILVVVQVVSDQNKQQSMVSKSSHIDMLSASRTHSEACVDECPALMKLVSEGETGGPPGFGTGPDAPLKKDESLGDLGGCFAEDIEFLRLNLDPSGLGIPPPPVPSAATPSVRTSNSLCAPPPPSR